MGINMKEELEQKYMQHEEFIKGYKKCLEDVINQLDQAADTLSNLYDGKELYWLKKGLDKFEELLSARYSIVRLMK